MSGSPIRFAVFLLPWLASLSLSEAQQVSSDAFDGLPPPAPSRSSEATPELIFELLADIALPGPLPDGNPDWIGDRVSVAVAGGRALARPEQGETARIHAASPHLFDGAEAQDWAVDGAGRLRYQASPDGSILAQRRCSRCSKGWKKHWKLRIAGATPAPPLVADRRVYFGARDNRIYCVKARNGHRRWVADIGGRVSRPLVLWTEPAAEERVEDPPLRLLLVVPDAGTEMLVLGGRSGIEVARMRLAANEGRIIGVPLITPDGRIAVARQKYVETEASLMIYRLRKPDPEEGEAEGDPNASPPVAFMF